MGEAHSSAAGFLLAETTRRFPEITGRAAGFGCCIWRPVNMSQGLLGSMGTHLEDGSGCATK